LVAVRWVCGGRWQADLKDGENDQLTQCLEALRRELAAVSDELGRFSSRSSQLERGTRVKSIFAGVTDGSAGASGRSSTSSSSSSTGGQLPRIDQTRRRGLSGSKKLA